MNYIPQVAKMLGVEVGERFTVSEFDGEFYFTSYGVYRSGFGYDDEILQSLLAGETQIKKLPWKPKERDRYFFPYINSGVVSADYTIWQDNCDIDKQRLEANMVCRTREEAIAKANKMLEAIKMVQEWGEP